MKLKSIITFFWAFLISGCALVFAEQSLYLNFYNDGQGNAYVSQGTVPNDYGTYGSLQGSSTELEQLSATAVTLESFMKNFEGNLYIASDLDLGQISGQNNCVVNHTPITFKSKSGKIIGNGKEIRNMCYSKQVKYGNGNDEVRNDSLGFFKILDGATVENLKFKNVQLSVLPDHADDVNPCKGKIYRPVGTLAGHVRNSIVEGITLSSIKISAPISGGLAGYDSNSTFRNIKSLDRMELRNPAIVKRGGNCAAGGSAGISWGGPYSVYVGGLVGYAINMNISDVDISIDVRNDVDDTTAALGGLVGLYAVSGQNGASNSLLVQKVNVGRKSKISRGKVMGGLFGEAGRFMHESGHARDLTIENSSFDGEFGPAYSDSGYVGGFIGHSYVDYGKSLKIINCSSNVKIDDSLKNENMEKYFVGGFIGRANPEMSGTRRDAQVSFISSKATGSINLTSSKDMKKLAIFAGGFAGFTPLAVNDSALLGDTSLVSIDVNVKTLKKDSTVIGGFVGFLKNKGEGGYLHLLKASHSDYSGYLRVKNSSNSVYSGGFFGIYSGMAEKYAVFFDNLHVFSDNVVESSSAEIYVGGVCGYANYISGLDRVAVNGDIIVRNAMDSLYVGGLVGSGFSNLIDFNLTNSYLVGDLDVSSTKDDGYVGYLMGYFSARGNGFKHDVSSNFHYGMDTYDAFGAFNGNIFDGSGNPVAWFDVSTPTCVSGNMCWDVNHNVRNGDNSVLNKNFNGMETSQFMKSDVFANFLNIAAEANFWLFDESKNEGFPYFSEVDLPKYSSSSEWSSSSVSSSSGWSSSSVSSSSGWSSSSVSSSSVWSSSSVFSSSSIVLDSNWVEKDKKIARSGEWNIISLAGLKEISLTENEALYWWDESEPMGEYYQYREYDPADKGDFTRGYWFYSDANVFAEYNDEVNLNVGDFVWNVDSLYSGWNLVANPYGWSIDVGDIDSDVELYRWNAKTHDYESLETIKPYEGIWVKTDSPKSLKIDATPSKGSSHKTLKKQAAMDPSNWQVQAILQDEFGRTDSWNFIGMKTIPSYGDEPPRGMGDRVNLSILEGKKSLAKSFKGATDNLEWTLQLSASSPRTAYLKLEGLENLKAWGKKVFVTVGDSEREIAAGESLQVSLKKEVQLVEVRVLDEAPIVRANSLSDVHVLLGQGFVNVRYDASENDFGKTVRVSLVSVSGKVVYSNASRVNSGMNSVRFAKPQKGVYVLHVSVGQTVSAQKIMVP